MIGKKINELATELAPLPTDLTIIGDPTTGVSKKITLEQISSLFGGSVSFYTNLAGFPAVGNIDIIYCAKDTNKLYLWSGSAYVEMFPSQALLDTYQLRSEKGNANGYASLDSLGKVPISQLPSSLMEYKGMWNAATNTPTLANGTGDTGDVYICNVAGTVNFGAGPITFAVGDYVIYSGTIWQRSSGAVGTVTSVAATITGDSVTISGSPVTTSGTLAFAFNGTTAQYIRGNGTLATFPSLTGFVPYTGATANVDLGTHTLLAKDLVINHSSGSGVAASITKGGSGEALTVVKSSGSGNAASITGGVTLLSELHLTTDLADAYIASATNWNAAYNDKINSAAVTGTTTKTLTLTQQDGGTITASWTDDNTDAVTSVFGRTGAVVAASGDYNTSQVTENTNLYFTNARAIASTLTGYTSGAGTITSSDSILSAIQKLNGNIGALTTGVSSVNGLTGAVTLTTSNIAEGTNLYYTEARVNDNTNVAANTAARHNAVTIGTANGLSLSTQVLSLGLASTSTTGALSSTDWNTFNNKTSNTGTVTSVGLSSATSGVTIGSTPITTSGTITLAIATASGSQQGLLSSTDWTTFNNKQNALTNPVTGTGTTNYLPKFTGASTIGNSQIFDNGTTVFINAITAPALGSPEFFVKMGTANSYEGILVASSSNNNVIAIAHTGSLGLITTNYGTSGANTPLAFGTNGAEQMRLDTSGNLGLGVTPSAWSAGQAMQIGSLRGLSLFGGTAIAQIGNNVYYNGGYFYGATGTATLYTFDNGGHNWAIAPSGTAGNAISFTQAMTLDASGRLGIGTTSPSTKLHVSGTAANTVAFVSDTTGYALYQLGSTSGGLYLGIDSSTASGFGNGAYSRHLYSTGAYPLIISTNDVERLRIASSGAATFSSSVTTGSTATNTAGLIVRGGSSIGTASASSGQILVGQTSTYRLSLAYDDNTGYAYIDNLYDNANSNIYIRTRTNGTPVNALTILGGGNVGIGTTSPSAILHTSSSTGTVRFASSTGNDAGRIVLMEVGLDAWSIDGDKANGQFIIRDEYNSATRLVIGNTGNVGIGTTSPTGRLMLYQSSAGNVFQNIVSNQGGSTQVGINFSPSMTDGEVAANPAQASIYATDSNFGANIIFANKTTGAVGNSLTERMRITSGGRVIINDTVGDTLFNINTKSSTAYSATGFNGNNSGIRITNGSAGEGRYSGISFGGGGNTEGFFGVVQNASNLADFVLQTYNGSAYGERMRMTSAGVTTFTNDVKVKTLEVTNVGTESTSSGISTYMEITVNGQNYVIPLHGMP
jgi:hypothetical protein